MGLNVEVLQSGPVGGDVQIASRVVDGKIDAVMFLVDPLDKHPHDPDIQTLLRICNVHDVPLATNIATADMVISSKLLWVAPEMHARRRGPSRLSSAAATVPQWPWRSDRGAVGSGSGAARIASSRPG